MKKKLFYLLIIASTSTIFAACCKKIAANVPLNKENSLKQTTETQNLLKNLKLIPSRGFMFGHHDDPLQELIGTDAGRSDVKVLLEIIEL